MTDRQNPFNPNSIVPRNLFAGRASYCLNILKKLAETKHGRPSSFFLYGERGIGKSALAKLIGYVATANDEKFYSLRFVKSYYAVEPKQTFRSVMEASLNNLATAVPTSWGKKLQDRLGDLFKNGKFSLGAFGQLGISVEAGAQPREQNITVRDQAVSILSNLLSTLKESKATEDSRDGILIIIDEMQNLKDIEVAAPLLRGILGTLDFNGLGYVSFLLIGLDQAFEDFMKGDASARRNFDPIRLDVMPPDEAMDVLQKGFRSIGLQWDEEALKAHIYVTGGYPHSIQVVGRNVVDVDANNLIAEDDWKTAIKQTAHELQEKEFSDMYCFAGKWRGRDRVLNMVASFGPMPRKELTEKCKSAYGMKNPYQYLSELEKCGAIRILATGVVELHSQLFRTAVLSALLPRLATEPGLQKMWDEVIERFTQSRKHDEKAQEANGNLEVPAASAQT